MYDYFISDLCNKYNLLFDEYLKKKKFIVKIKTEYRLTVAQREIEKLSQQMREIDTEITKIFNEKKIA